LAFDPHGYSGRALGKLMVGGFKGVQYLFSRKYRAKAYIYWKEHPGKKFDGVSLMIFGVMFDILLAWIIVKMIRH
jgi:hypothetical protein